MVGVYEIIFRTVRKLFAGMFNPTVRLTDEFLETFFFANSRFLGLVSVGTARSLDRTELRPSVIKRMRQIDVQYITHM